MATHIKLYDLQYPKAAARILARHDALQPEANITSARRELRKWLRASTEGKSIEIAVAKLLSR